MPNSNDVDNDIAYSAVMNAVFAGGGLQQLQQTLANTDDPIQALSSMIYTMLGSAREASQGKIELDKSIWLKAGGVVDRVTKDVCQIAASMGIQGAETPEFGVQVKRAVVSLMRNEDQKAMQQEAPPQQAGLLAQAGAPA